MAGEGMVCLSPPSRGHTTFIVRGDVVCNHSQCNTGRVLIPLTLGLLAHSFEET